MLMKNIRMHMLSRFGKKIMNKELTGVLLINLNFLSRKFVFIVSAS